MPRGGSRPGAGRKPGVRNKQTREVSDAFRKAFSKKLGQGNFQKACESFVVLLVKLIGEGNAQAAIHLSERVFGKVPMPIQHGGEPDNPIKHEHVVRHDR